MLGVNYLPASSLPLEIAEAAEKLHVFFEKQGLREWQYSYVADRRLVNKLERELEEAKQKLIYIVYDNHKFGTYIIGAYSSKEEAEKAAKECNAYLQNVWVDSN